MEYVKEGGNWYLRTYIDKEGGITVDDCEVISRTLSDWLDKEDFIGESYIMEVSSPGLGRPLKKEKDLARSIGKEVEVKLYKPLEKSKEYAGVLSITVGQYAGGYGHPLHHLQRYRPEAVRGGL